MTPEERQARIDFILANQPEPDSFGKDALEVFQEFGNGWMRSVTGMTDVMTTPQRTILNGMLKAFNTGREVPTLTETAGDTFEGGQMDGPLGPAVGAAGEIAPTLAGGGAAGGLALKGANAAYRAGRRKVGGMLRNTMKNLRDDIVGAPAQAAKPRVRVRAGEQAQMPPAGASEGGSAVANMIRQSTDSPLSRWGLARTVQAMTGSPRAGQFTYVASHPRSQRQLKRTLGIGE